MSVPIVSFRDVEICAQDVVLLTIPHWDFNDNEYWVLTGTNGGGKSVLADSLCRSYTIRTKPEGRLFIDPKGEILHVSFEQASELIAQERLRDDSEFIDGGVDIGRTVLSFLTESGAKKEEIDELIARCALSKVTDRGLRYLSTGEIRRTLLCAALLKKSSLLILDEPYEGLDTEGREIMNQILSRPFYKSTRFLLVIDQHSHIPQSCTHVLELVSGNVAFCGPKADFDDYCLKKVAVNTSDREKIQSELQLLKTELHNSGFNTFTDVNNGKQDDEGELLVEMNNVSVSWSGKKVLDNLTWTLRKNEHTLIRGPNGSGKTTFLELITGDNPQVFCNDISIFGKKRGSGETIWELKERMGIVSYKLHLEYRLLGDISIENVLISGLHDSIGLYCDKSHSETALAEHWLTVGGFGGRGKQSFKTLSYGEQRCIIILRSTIKQPPLLILDEPCHGLDEDHRKLVLSLLEKIAATGDSTLLHVTHDPDEKLMCEKHILEFLPGESPMYRTLFPGLQMVLG